MTIDGSDFTKADGDVSGRKAIIAAQNDIAVTADGTADHVVVDDGTEYEASTCTSIGLSNGGTVSVPAWDIESGDPT